MQTLAEQYLQQGIEEGARQMSIENTLMILTRNFPGADVTAVKSRLEAIEDLNRLKQVTLKASIVSSFRDFQEDLEA